MSTILFLSSGDISIPLLRELIERSEFEVVGLVCQPDRPAGRGQKLKAPASKLLAEEHGVPIYQPESLRKDQELLEKLRNDPPDFLLTFAYGQILSDEWLELPRVDALNVHTSLLPKYRGASPIQAAILNGDSVTGLSLMRMAKKMDAGPVFVQVELEVGADETAGELHDRLADFAAEVVPSALANFNDLDAQEQGAPSYCGKISKEDARMDFGLSAEVLHRRFRAYSPWPGLWTTWEGKRLKILDCEVGSGALKPGQVQAKLLGCAEGVLKLKRVQLEGKSAMTIEDFLRGQAAFASAHLPS